MDMFDELEIRTMLRLFYTHLNNTTMELNELSTAVDMGDPDSVFRYLDALADTFGELRLQSIPIREMIAERYEKAIDEAMDELMAEEDFDKGLEGLLGRGEQDV